MATPAAILEVTVDANTATATANLNRFDRTLRGTGTTAGKTGRYHDDLNKRTSRLGGALRTAAFAAGGAAAAYLSISQAKTAVTTTQDLAKTTMGLNRNLGLGIKRASQWGAVAKARDIDTRSLNMSFTTLSRNLVEARRGTEANVEQFKRLGISQEDLKSQKFNETLLEVADAFGEAEGGAKRQATAQKLLGRGYQTVLPLFAEGSKSLKEQLGWADKYGATLENDTLRAQMDLVAAQRESKVAMLGLQVAFTQALTPALKKANEQFQRISQIMSNDKLTGEEKWKRVGRIIGRWADKAFDAFVGILPKIIEEAGQRAPAIAGALVKGFLQADIWGKLLVGGWLFAKLGGAAAFRSTGERGGKFFGRGFVLGAILALPLLLPEAFELGKKIGREIKRGIRDVEVFQWAAEQLEHVFGLTRELTKREAIAGVKAGAKGDMSMEAALEGLVDAGIKIRRAREIVQREYGFAHDAAEKANEGIRDENRKTGDSNQRAGKSHADLAAKATRTSTEMGQRVSGNVGNMVTAVNNGYNRLKDNTNKALKAFNAKPINFTVVDGKKVGTSGLQRGGPITQGAPVGDSVPAMLEKGEYVLNRNAVAAVGKDRLDSINFGAAKRFAVGGMAGLQPGISRLASWAADRYGLRISSGLRPGTGSLHNIGAAVDLVPPGMTATKGIFAAFKNQLAELFYDPWGGYNDGQMIGPIGDHMDHIHAAILGAGSPAAGVVKLAKLILKGPKGPLRNMGQGGLDKTYAAAKKYLARNSMTAHGNIGNISGPLQAIAQRMIAQTWGMGQWPFFNDLVMRESGWDPTAVNPSSGAAGLAQALPPSKYPPGAWPYTGKESAVKQLQWMIQYIQGRYGNPAGAIAWHNAHNWYQKGGYVGSYATGGTVPRDGMAQVHKGETITPAHKKEWDKLIHDQLKEIAAEMREQRRLQRQAKDVIRSQGKRWFVDAMGEEIGSSAVRNSRYAGNGNLTHIGGRRG